MLRERPQIVRTLGDPADPWEVARERQMEGLEGRRQITLSPHDPWTVPGGLLDTMPPEPYPRRWTQPSGQTRANSALSGSENSA